MSRLLTTQKMLVTYLLVLLLVGGGAASAAAAAAVDPLLQPWSGTCGQCLFQNPQNASDGGTGCLTNVYQTAWDTQSTHHNNYVPMELCLGYVDSETDEKKRTSFTRVNGAPNQRLEAVSLWALRLKFQITAPAQIPNTPINAPPGSSFAMAQYDLAKDYGNNIDMANSSWLYRGNVASAYKSVVSFVASRKTPKMSRDECIKQSMQGFADIWALNDCLGIDGWQSDRCSQNWPFCVPDGWQEYVTTGLLNPFSEDGQWKYSSWPSVVTRTVWCTPIGFTAPEERGLICGRTRCNHDPFGCAVKDSAEAIKNKDYCNLPQQQQNHCLNSALCKCEPHFGGSQCEFQFNRTAGKTGKTFYDKTQTTRLPNSWRRLGERIQDKTLQDDWGEWWTCKDFDPCSGAGTCVDSGNRNEPPACQCYAGFFGSGPGDVEAYARTFFCNNGKAGSGETLWTDTDKVNDAVIRRYLMTHQCLLWRGEDNPSNWARAVLKWTPDAQQPTLDIYKPSLPFHCAPNRAGPNCTICPPCARGNGTCKAAGASGNICECDDNHIGLDCSQEKCPLNQYPVLKPGAQVADDYLEWSLHGSPCGFNEGRGVCVRTVTPTNGTRNKDQPPFSCRCNNGYSGPGCALQPCAVPVDNKGKELVQFVNNSLICSNHGKCIARNATHGSCSCDKGYTGVACQLLQCPTAPRVNATLEPQVCNGLVTSTGQSVCVNHSPFQAPYCSCRDAQRRWLLDRWFGDACQYSYNLTCMDTNMQSAASANRTWCHSASKGVDMCQIPIDVLKQLQGNGRALNQMAPQCQCEIASAELTGTYCERSKCGVRKTPSGALVPPTSICSGYTAPPGQPIVTSGRCNVETSDRLTFAHCVCEPSFANGKRTTFQGAYCQTPVPSCTNEKALLQMTIKNGVVSYGGNLHPPVDMQPCSSTSKEQHGACVRDASNNDVCRCLENWTGTYCELPKAICRPACTEGAGICVLGKGQTGDHCDCYGDKKFIWSNFAGNKSCDVNWCEATGGITTMLARQCICPAGTLYTSDVKVAPGAKLVQRSDDNPFVPKDVTQLAGCRRLCPLSGQLQLECGGVENSCSTIRTARNISSFLQKPVCLYNSAKTPDILCYKSDVPLQSRTEVTDPYESPRPPSDTHDITYFSYNAGTGTCDPYCSNGAQMKKRNNKLECLCPPERMQYCGNFTGTFFEKPLCNDHGTWVQDPLRRTEHGAGVCVCTGLYTAASMCVKSSCDNGEYSPALGPNVCNCSYPFETNLDDKTSNFGKCIPSCVRGKPSPAVSGRRFDRFCECPLGWTGDYCEQSRCVYGNMCKTPRANAPCCCTTPIATGPFCANLTCLNRGEPRFHEDAPPTCQCLTPFFVGAQCEIDQCGILGDGGWRTGRYSFTEKKCICIAGYAPDAGNKLCTKPRCGPRGTVLSNGKPEGAAGGHFTCKCDGPDQAAPDGTCTEGQCGPHGTLIIGLNGTKAECQCEQGYSGVDCSVSQCGDPLQTHTVFEPLLQACDCLYPYVNMKTQCRSNVCGLGADSLEPVRMISQPGNPVEFECSCDKSRGYRLAESPLLSYPTLLRTVSSEEPDLHLQQSFMFAIGRGEEPAACVLDCDTEHTLKALPDKCICHVNYTGNLCDSRVSDRCPQCVDCSDVDLPVSGMVSRRTFYIGMFVPMAVLSVALIAAVLGTYFSLKSTTDARAGAGSGAPLQPSTASSSRSRLLQRPI